MVGLLQNPPPVFPKILFYSQRMLLELLAWAHTSKPNGLDNFEPKKPAQMYEQGSCCSQYTGPVSNKNKIKTKLLFHLFGDNFERIQANLRNAYVHTYKNDREDRDGKTKFNGNRVLFLIIARVPKSATN